MLVITHGKAGENTDNFAIALCSEHCVAGHKAIGFPLHLLNIVVDDGHGCFGLHIAAGIFYER